MMFTGKRFACVSVFLAATLVVLSGCSNSDFVNKFNHYKASRNYHKLYADSTFDPYLTENVTALGQDMTEKHDDTDYGRIDADLEYDSSTAGHTKRCSVLLPPGYHENETYPVMYAIHGWGGDNNSIVWNDSYLQLVYGNMLRESRCVPMIIVGVDMYTDDPSTREQEKSDEELRLIYDKVVDDIKIDLMPFIEERYPVKTGRLNTAVAGLSQGAVESLAIGFKWQDTFGYIGSFAPDPGVIPTREFVKYPYWNISILDDLAVKDKKNIPRYIYLSVGTLDPWNIEIISDYGDVMEQNGIMNQVEYIEGYAHDAEFWRLCFYNFMSKLFQ